MWKYFKEMERILSVQELNDLATEVAEAYADPRGTYETTKKMLAEEFEMTPNIVDKLLDYAVVHSLVSSAVVYRMEKRAEKNQRRYSPDKKAHSVHTHYSELRRKRIEYQICMLTKVEIKEVAVRFAENSQITKEDLAISYGLDKSSIDVILKKAITENICDDETFKKIERRSLAVNGDPQVKEFFNQLRKRREATKKNFFA